MITAAPAQNAQIHPIELARPLTSLAESVSNSIAPLYSLHIALAQAYGEKSQQVQLFSKSKKIIGAEWESWLSFLRECIGYARNYIALCQSLQTGSPMHHESLTHAIISHLQKICSDIERLRKSYAAAVEQFASLAQTYNPPSRTTTNHGRSKTRRGPPRINLPVILQAFAVTMKTLRTSSTHLGVLSAFWADHSSRLLKMSAATNSLKAFVQSGRLPSELATWTKFHEALRQTSSNITSYCDAAAVTPIIPSGKLGKATVNISFSMDCNATPLDGSERSKIQEAGYYEVLTAPYQYNMSDLIKLTMEIQKGVERFASESRQTPKGLPYPLQSQIDKYNSTVPEIEKIAVVGAAFYSLVQELGKKNDAAIASSLLSHAMTEIAGRSAREDRSTTEKQGPNTGMLQDFVSRLQQLIQRLIDLDHFWFGLLAGVEYLSVKGLIDVTDRNGQNVVWDRQRVDYERYKTQVQSRGLSSGEEERFSKGWRRFFCLA
ncbi:hypothetical protein PC9H_005884 [Pleurotus ostreatus]|uniref:Uncharacterized protein n=1 Tax=Pleurotus ostreatus TaxID=5322 RepID=A0A8H6ZT23_PLEOS|nr:uncharacterized protein PC9H_005884 [Pleurotus ostreatus]KAF7430184.1 hypothetical protein PC9H_005884 [Pleurotus ostreatus]